MSSLSPKGIETKLPKMENTNIVNANTPNSETNDEAVIDTPAETDALDENLSESEADTTVSKEEHDKLKKEKDELYVLYKKAKAAKVNTNAVEADLSTRDVLFLAKADVHEDDIDEVLEWAKFKKVSVSEAHKQLKGVLAGKAEERKTAQATNTGAARRGTSKVSDDTLLERADKGELPEDADLERIVRARMNNKKNKA